MSTDVAPHDELRLASPSLARTGGLPLLGVLPKLLRHQFDALLALHREHGDMFWLDVAGQSVLMVCHPTIIEEAIVRKAHGFVRGGPLYGPIRPLAGNGLLAADGEFWRRQRRLMQPLFHQKIVADMTTTVSRCIARELDAWALSRTDPHEADITPLMTRISMQVTLDAIFGTDLDDERADRLGDNLKVVLDHIIVGWLTAGLPRWLPIPGQRRHDRAMREVDEELHRLIDERRRRDDYGTDILGLLMHANEQEGSSMDDQLLRDELASLIVAGYEATGHTLTWALWLLAEHPEILARVRQEARTHLPTTGTVTFADVQAMRWTRWSWEETLRLYPSGLFLPRVALGDQTLAGHPVPEGTTVLGSIYNVHHHPGLWDEPERFAPERFAPERLARAQARGRHRLAFMPFGLGMHLCLGKPLAMLEGILVLAMMARDFELESIDRRRPRPRISTTMRSDNGVWLRTHRLH